MTTKRTKPKPVKMWAIFGEDGWVVEIAATKHRAVRAALAWNLSDHVHRVLVTPIEPKKRGKK